MKSVIPILLAIAVVTPVATATASENSAGITPVVGPLGPCKVIAIPQTALQMGTSNVVNFGKNPSSTKVTGPVAPERSSVRSNESATVFGTRSSLGFKNATTRINFAVVRSGSNSAVHRYPSGGVTSDNGLRVIVGGSARPIDEINLCYALSGPVDPDPPQAPIAACPLAPNCPDDGERRLVCDVNLSDDGEFSGGVTAGNCCVCNGDPLAPCDPELDAGVAGSCLDVDATAANEVPTSIELNEDPYVCTTSGGKRTCYKY